MLNLFHKSAEPSGPVEYIIVGLGNPGPQYEGTHHNAGFMAIDALAEKCGVKIDRLKFKGLCATATLAGKKVLLLKPSTFMNLSGQSVTEAMRFYKLPPERVIILYDDISFPPGKLRIRMKGSDGGQNGMKNIIYLAGSDAFPRIRLGTGDRPDRRYDLADWVLAKFTESDKKLFDQAVENACAALELMVQGKTAEAMSLYNGKG
ncbi:aminoacyl-tRNA hydrolase [Thermocaproicibacter melissae]|uniref:aminoacyl-tRNA hydrolase n=1 Tax=Thermocaproicibacter melissae TaxID=2966552 RepID=UPI0024B080B9|nr:aminoacyl-tRNA hydrolase [Thermocaproicibacter melissae]WBY63897.1 aminoacyl-tRNA hydrolase [Thermocaproicibacter melissae]